MSKIIKLTDDVIASVQQEFIDALKRTRMADGKFNFQKSFDKIDLRASLRFTEVAWIKMQILIQSIDKEVAWHGVVKRGDAENEYIVSDVLVYPQKIAAATVESDDDAYPLWYAKLTDTPEVFDNLRMQGHSHVNMGVTPSTTDMAFYQKLLNLVGEDSFYVFVIYNKKGDKTVKIYDFAKNVLFETQDVDVSVIDNGSGFDQFLKDAKDMVKPETYKQKTQTPTAKPTYNYSGGFNGYSNYNSHGYQPGNYSKYYADEEKEEKKGKKNDSPKYKAGFRTFYDYEDDF